MSSEVSLLPAEDGRASDSGLSPTSPAADAVLAPERAAQSAPSLVPFWSISLAVVLIDQITKALVVATLPLYASRTLIPNLVDLVHVQNAGVAFGLFNDFAHPLRSVVTIALALVALVGIGYYARQLRPEERMARIGLFLILGGAVGNLLDRIRQGFVTDFIDVYWHNWHFWAFNAADAAISVGATLIFIELLITSRHAPHSV